MNVIRLMRIHKFRKKNWGLILIAKTSAIILLISMGVIYLTGNTGAYFNDNSTATGIFTAGFWETVKETWDKSSLNFPNKEQDQVVAGCGPTAIGTILKNTGDNMQGQTEYYVFFNESGNPKHGKQVGEGIIQPIEHNQTGTIQFKVSAAGNYKIKALQRPGHGNKDDVRHELWSETITLKCEPVPLKDTKKETEESDNEASNETNQSGAENNIENHQETESNHEQTEEVEENSSSEVQKPIDNNEPNNSDAGDSGGE